MVLNPEVQKRAQEEIDAVVGGDRLPNFDDRPSLPYIEAVFREVPHFANVINQNLTPISRACAIDPSHHSVSARLTDYSRTIRNVRPLGVVRSTSSDDDYEGYFIPKGQSIATFIGLDKQS
jgi:phospholipid N-methyltransferase